MFRGTPPAPSCGVASPYTTLLRPRVGMDDETCKAARDLKRHDPSLTAGQIADRLDGAAECDVRLALATIRTRNPRRSRGTLNATLEAVALVEREAQDSEPRWATLDRLLGELVQLRAVVAGLSAGGVTRRSDPAI